MYKIHTSWVSKSIQIFNTVSLMLVNRETIYIYGTHIHRETNTATQNGNLYKHMSLIERPSSMLCFINVIIKKKRETEWYVKNVCS